MTSQFKLVTFGGEDYSISICYERKFKKVRIRLIEDNADHTVLYDNADFDYKETMTFSNNVARKIIIEISVPEDPTNKDNQELRCVGVLIHFRKTYEEPKNKIGF
jgi:6-pyruvoyl-tetrahydropterin synthase